MAIPVFCVLIFLLCVGDAFEIKAMRGTGVSGFSVQISLDEK